MKKILLTTLVVILGLPMLAQEISFPAAIVSAGGSSEGSSVTLSRWRLAPVHVITLPENKFKEKDLNKDADWSVTVYPNPVEDALNLEFDLPEQREFLLKITDVSGRVMVIKEPQAFIDGSSVELDFSSYIPALYLLQISSPDLKSQQIYRIQKL